MSDLHRPSRSGCSSSSSSVVGGVNLGLVPHIPGETLPNPNCTCGSPAHLRISWTERNPGRRFYNCNRCRFFMWVDPEVNWYNSVLLCLLSKKTKLESEIVDSESNIEQIEMKNKLLQDLLDEYLEKEGQHGIAMAVLQSKLKKLESKKTFYKKVVVVLVAMVVVLLLM